MMASASVFVPSNVSRRLSIAGVTPLIFLLLGNAVVWALYGTLGGHPVQHQDTLEAYAWGREFQLGYWKHPPLWAWVAALWSTILPRQDWSLYLLSELNASLGILGAWALIGRFTQGPARAAGCLLLLLTTLYSFNALRFNANTFQLSVWPWTMYFFVRSIEDRTIRSGVLFGLFAGLAVLSKYYAFLLLASCFVAALQHEDRQAYFRSAVPWVTFLTFELVLAPHVVWLVRDGYQPVLYLVSKVEPSDAKFVDTLPGFALACLLYHALQIVLVAACRLAGRSSTSDIPVRHGLTFLSTLALGPFLLTLAAGVTTHMRLTPLYAVPIFSLTPFLLLVLVRPSVDLLTKWILRLYFAVAGLSLVAAPAIAYYGLKFDSDRDAEPFHEISQVAERQWGAATRAPIRIVAGSWPYSLAAAFYIPGPVSEFTAFKTAWAPWVTPERIRHEGLLYMCLERDVVCLDGAAKFVTPESTVSKVSVARHVLDVSATPVTFLVGVVPPAGQGGTAN